MQPITCQSSNGVQPIGLYFGYLTPSSPNGTIVFFTSDDGTTPDGAVPESQHTIEQYASDYYSTFSYQVIQTAWDNVAWEDASSDNSGGNIGYAACRPATFLSYVYNRFYTPIYQNNATAGMCIQGESAGGAAGAFALAWYGAGSASGGYIDKLSLMSSPPLSDISQGCYYDNGSYDPPVEVCPPGQLGCNATNNPVDWTQAIQYTNALHGVREWTGDKNCGGPNNTTPAELANWKSMSIVDGNIGTFNYPKTNITAWLCSMVASGGGPMNNSSPEAQLFFQQFANSSQYEGLTINGVINCGNSEEVGPGTPPSNYTKIKFEGQYISLGWQAIEYDMVQDPINSCFSHHSQ